MPSVFSGEESQVADVAAPPVSSKVDTLSIEHAVAEAFNNHPQLQAAAAAVRKQQHLVYQSTRKPNPVVGYTASEVGNDGEAGQQGLFLSQDFVRGGKLALNGQIRERDVSIAAHELRLRQKQVEADTRLAFLDVAVAQERQKLLNRLQESLSQAQESAKRLWNSGITSASSVSQAQLEAQSNVMQIERTKTQLAIAKLRLAALIGRDNISEEVTAGILLPGDNEEELNQLWEKIGAGSPEIALAGCRYDQSQWKVRREIAEPIPDLQTQWSLQQDAATNHTVLGIQLGVELPVRDKNRGAINAARAESWRSHHQIDSVRRDLRQRLVLTYGQLQQADQQLKFIREELEGLARENVQKTQQAFSLGEATYLNLLNAQRGYISLSLNTLKLYQQRAVAKTHLQTYLVRATTSNE